VDYDDLHPDERNTVYLIEGKSFDDQVALERGNYSYLMGCDLDFQSEEVRKEIAAWGRWTLDTTGVDGFRLDAVKHISAWFFPEWLDAMEKHCGKNLFVVGSTGPPRPRPSTGTSTVSRAGPPSSACRCTTGSTTRAEPAGTSTCAACSKGRSCSPEARRP